MLMSQLAKYRLGSSLNGVTTKYEPYLVEISPETFEIFAHLINLLVQETMTMNPNPDGLPDGVAPQLLWAKGYFAEQTKGNLPLTLADLNYNQFGEGRIYLGATADMTSDRGGVNVNFNVVLNMKD